MALVKLEMYNALLEKHLRRSLIKACYESILHNDAAHNVDHVFNVCRYGLQLTQGNVSAHDRSIILAGCLMHDLGCRYNRENHHVISFGLAFKMLDEYATGMFDEEDALTIATTCLEHRASWDKPRSSYQSDYVALADRGEPNLDEMIRRCIVFRMAGDQPRITEDLKKEVFEHMQEKCGTNGYMWKSYPGIGWEINKNLIQNICRIVDDRVALMQCIDRVYATYYP